MTVTITDRSEWERALTNIQPQWIVVSSECEWFRGGTGMTYRWVR